LISSRLAGDDWDMLRMCLFAGALLGCGSSGESATPAGNAGVGGAAPTAGTASGGTAPTAGSASGGRPPPADAGSGGAMPTAGNASGGRPPTGGSHAGGMSVQGGGGSASGGKAGNGNSGGSTGLPSEGCAPLAALPANAILVTPEQADELPSIVRGAAPGATIALADGTYRMSGGDEAARRIQLIEPGITLRSVSANAEAVILDGEYQTEEMVTINASDVTIAAVTLTRAVNHAIHVTGGPTENVSNVRLTGLRIIDAGEQFVKVNSSGATPNTYADHGILECSLLELTARGRPQVEPTPGGCYTGGIDAHSAQGWVVRLNTFRGIYCEGSGLAEHAVHFWSASRDTLVERNIIIDCARGIGFGLGDGSGAGADRDYDDEPSPGVGGYVGHHGGVIRNNWLSISDGLEYFDTGIELEQAHGARVLHNTLLHPATAFASIAPRFPNTSVSLLNNLMVSLRERDGATVEAGHNSTAASANLFVDASAHDLRLSPAATVAIDQGEAAEDAGLDIDGNPHDNGVPDLGAHELR
jgi:hypothetical protein